MFNFPQFQINDAQDQAIRHFFIEWRVGFIIYHNLHVLGIIGKELFLKFWFGDGLECGGLPRPCFLDPDFPPVRISVIYL